MTPVSLLNQIKQIEENDNIFLLSEEQKAEFHSKNKCINCAIAFFNTALFLSVGMASTSIFNSSKSSSENESLYPWKYLFATGIGLVATLPFALSLITLKNRYLKQIFQRTYT